MDRLHALLIVAAVCGWLLYANEWWYRVQMLKLWQARWDARNNSTPVPGGPV